MTDHELLNRIYSCLDPTGSELWTVHRNGRILLALPSQRQGGNRALSLYQPQRQAARALVKGLHGLSAIGLRKWVLPKLLIQVEQNGSTSLLQGVESGTCGVLLGSPEHRVRRAIASYRRDGQWEVAKLSFGNEGRRTLEQEAHSLEKLQVIASGVPQLLGLHHLANDITLLRMPYLEGDPIPIGQFEVAMGLLNGWMGESPAMPISAFPEWPFIESALSEVAGGRRVLARLSRESLRPAICHGDFTRWNLRIRDDGSPVVLDWEWGNPSGMPGLDLVHYFLQDRRLVQRKAPEEAMNSAVSDMNFPECTTYLRTTGWSDERLLAIIACLAWKQGARHQDNRDYLKAAMTLVRS